MIDRSLSKRYAKALFQAALNKDAVDEIQKDIENCKLLIDKDSSFVRFLLSPQILTSAKNELVEKALRGRANDLFVDFILLLIDKKRIDHVHEIFEAHTVIYEAYRGIIKAKVVTAVPLDDAQEAAVMQKLHSETKREIHLKKVTDPDIIGGMVIYLGDKVIDGSVKFQLEGFRKKLKETKVY
jgi:F-type H+-transporting ATPase subunit delta